MSLANVDFSPSPTALRDAIKGEPYIALTGVNNSGKSSYLKGLFDAYTGAIASFVPVSRFVESVELQAPHVGPMPGREGLALQLFQSPTNTDGGGIINIATRIKALSDDDRDRLFEVAQLWIGAKFTIRLQDPGNRLSPFVFETDGGPFSITSTGTRLLFYMLVALSDSTVRRVLIDEPELGLSPNLQSMVFNTLSEPNERKKLFPHIEQVVVATHSHLFLDRSNLARNHIVEKEAIPVPGQAVLKTKLSARPVPDITTFQAVQLRLLGNSLASFYLPEAIVVVEGKTDHPYLAKIISLELPGHNISVVHSQGDLKTRVYMLSHAMGGVQRTPYADRLFAIFDKVIGEDQVKEIAKLGVNHQHIVRWEKNGIEFLYPDEIVKKIFAGASIVDCTIEGDKISANGITHTKASLSGEVCKMIGNGIKFPPEIQDKLIKPLKAAIGVP